MTRPLFGLCQIWILRVLRPRLIPSPVESLMSLVGRARKVGPAPLLRPIWSAAEGSAGRALALTLTEESPSAIERKVGPSPTSPGSPVLSETLILCKISDQCPYYSKGVRAKTPVVLPSGMHPFSSSTPLPPSYSIERGGGAPALLYNGGRASPSKLLRRDTLSYYFGRLDSKLLRRERGGRVPPSTLLPLFC